MLKTNILKLTWPDSSNAMINDHNSVEFSVIDRDYAKNATYFTANSHFVAMTPMSSSGAVVSPFAVNVYPHGEPQLVELDGGKRLLVWIGDDSSRTDINRTALMYSFYDGHTWSTPAQVDDDGTPDFSPVVTVAGNKAYIAWMNADKVFTEVVDIHEMSRSMNICVAVFDSETGVLGDAVNVSALLDPERERVLDMMPAISAQGGNVSVSWVSNSESDVFAETGENTIYTAVLDGGTWQASMFEDGLPKVTAIDSAYINGKYALAFSTAQLGEGVTEALDVFMIYDGQLRHLSRGMRNSDALPMFSGDILYWFSNGNINYIEDFDSFGIKTIEGSFSGNFVVASGSSGRAILYTNSEDGGSEIFGVLYDSSVGMWSSPIQLTNEGLRIDDITGYIDNSGDIILAFNGTQIIEKSTEENPALYGATTLYTLAITPSYALELMSPARFNPVELLASEELNIRVLAANTGERTINGITVDVLDMYDTVLYSQDIDILMLPGQSGVLEISYPLSPGFAGQHIQIQAYPKGLSAQAVSNKISVEIGEPLVVVTDVETSYDNDNDIIRVYARIANLGSAPIENRVITLRYDSPEGEVFHSTNIEKMDGFTEILLPIELDPNKIDFSDGSNRAAYAVVLEENGALPENSSRAFLFVLASPFEKADGVAVSGVIRSYNPKNPTLIRLMQGDTEVRRTTIAPVDGTGQVEQTFTIEGVPPGTYTLVITKPAHLSFTVKNIVVGDENLDLKQDVREAVRLMTLLCGDVNGDGFINVNDVNIIWSSLNYGKSVAEAANPLADLNGDGLINVNDLNIARSALNYGRGPVVIE